MTKGDLMPVNFYDIIIDKGCLDCIMTESTQENADSKMINSLKEINKIMSDNGTFYYFSTGKPEKRISYLSQVFNCKIEIEEISIY